MQQHQGNQFVQRLLRPGLPVGAAGDRYERDAERIADAVTGSLGGACGRDRVEGIEGRESGGHASSRTLRPEPAAAAVGCGERATPALSARIQSTLGQGQPLSDARRRELGRRMGADFGGVRVHDDAEAASMCSDLGAHAFTLGRDIYFAAGRYDTRTLAGTHLLAHELAHTIPQTIYV